VSELTQQSLTFKIRGEQQPELGIEGFYISNHFRKVEVQSAIAFDSAGAAAEG
jgi:hypothetical protein